MSLSRAFDGGEPAGPEGAAGRARIEHHHHVIRTSRMAVGTLACPGCDAPVVPPRGGAGAAARLACPYCAHAGALRDFLSLAAPSRPARVVVNVVPRRAA